MNKIEPNEKLRCPACAYTLSEDELQSGVCDHCEKEFNTDRLIARNSDLAKQESDDLKAILAERLGAALGVLMIAAGTLGVCFSQVGPAQLLSRWGVSSILATVVSIIYFRMSEWPMYRVLLGCGFVWMFWGILMCNYL